MVCVISLLDFSCVAGAERRGLSLRLERRSLQGAFVVWLCGEKTAATQVKIFKNLRGVG